MALATKTFSSYDYVGKDGRYLSLTVSETSNNAADNTSTLSWTLSTIGGAVTYYDTFCQIKINGTQVYFSNGLFSAAGYSGWIGSANHPIDTDVWIDANGNENTCAKWGFSTSGSGIVVNHNKNGTANIKVEFLVGIFYYVVKDCGGSISLEALDRTGPTVIQNNPTSVTYNSCSISATSNVNCNRWEYSMDGGNSWLLMSTTTGTSASKDITGLSPNTSYEFIIQARKASNSVWTKTETKTITTLGASILNSVNDIYLDITSPSITFNATAYSSTFYNRLTITKGNSSITINLGTINVDTNTYTKTFSSSQLNTLFGWIGNNFEVDGINVKLSTYTTSGYGTKIGQDSTFSNIKLIIRKENAQPTLTIGGYEDTNSTTIAITGNNSYIIPGSGTSASTIRINNIVGTTKYRATITSIVIKNVNQNISQTIVSNTSSPYNNNYTWGKVSSDTACFLEATLTDSRGEIAKAIILIKIYRPGTLIVVEDYDNWYNILYNQYNAKDYNGNYYITGTTSRGFNLQSVDEGDIVEASYLSSTTNGVYKHINSIPISSGDYYYDERNVINNIKSIVQNNNITKGDLIETSLKSDLDSNFALLDNVRLFNLIKGE